MQVSLEFVEIKLKQFIKYLHNTNIQYKINAKFTKCQIMSRQSEKKTFGQDRETEDVDIEASIFIEHQVLMH